MIEIKNLNECKDSNITYGGHSGSKKGIIINNEKWFIKYPKSTKSMEVKGMSYTTTPLSEYLGSHIYESIGIDCHETILGYSDNKIVVACKDFLKSTEEILDYNAIKNNYDEKIEKYLEEHSSSKFDRNNDIEEIEMIMENNKYFKKIPELKTRFWDMFVIDALISNNDRNEGNWGLIIDKETSNLRLAPVYDNGAAFYGKSSDEKLKNSLEDEFKFKQMVYDSCVSTFIQNEKIINPLKYIESMKNIECNKALIRLIPKINIEKIKQIIDEIPKTYNDIPVFSEIQRKAYIKMLEYKLEKILKPIYKKLIEAEN